VDNQTAIETFKAISIILASVLIPAVLALIGHYVTKAIKEREIQGRFVELALDILRQHPDTERQNIRKWAVDIVNKYSGVPMDDLTRKDLIKRVSLEKDLVPRIIDGKDTLEVINDKINFQEAAGGEFVGSEPDQDKGVNIAKFKRLPPGQKPANPIKLIKKGESPPSNTTEVWTGKMIVEGKLEEVEAYR